VTSFSPLTDPSANYLQIDRGANITSFTIYDDASQTTVVAPSCIGGLMRRLRPRARMFDYCRRRVVP